MNIAAHNEQYGLTRRQQDALRFIRGFLEAKGHSPSFGQIMQGLGASNKSCVHWLLNALEERGHLRRLPGKHSSIELLADIDIPRDPAGEPLYSCKAAPFGKVRGGEE